MIDPTAAKLIMHTLSKMDESIVSWDDLPKPSEDVRADLCEKLFPPIRVESILRKISGANFQALVVTDNEGLVEWASPAFTRMCGYSLLELRGQKPGKMLQGEETSAESVEILRDGIQEHRPVQVQLMNYHKLGDRYEVKIELVPLYSESGEKDGFIAVETEVATT